MDRVVPQRLLTAVANWRAGVFGALVIVIGLTLDLAVLGANPIVNLAPSAPQDTEQSSAPIETAPVSTAMSADAAIPTGSTDVPVDDPFVEPIVPAVSNDDAEGPPPAEIASAVVAVQHQPSGAPASPDEPSPGPIAAPSTAAPTTAAPTKVAPSTTPSTTSAPAPAPSTTSAPTTVAPTTTPASAPVEYLTYTVSGGVGDVVLARQGNSLSLYGFYPASGWVREVESNGPRTVKLKFFNVQTEQDREWKATIESGRIQVEN